MEDKRTEIVLWLAGNVVQAKLTFYRPQIVRGIRGLVIQRELENYKLLYGALYE